MTHSNEYSESWDVPVDFEAFDATGAWRTITDPLPTKEDAHTWRMHMKARGFDTRIDKRANGYVLSARKKERAK